MHFHHRHGILRGVLLSLVCVPWLGLGIASCPAAAEPHAVAPGFHVAPRGNDRWSGTQAAPNEARTDGPFATLGRARDAVRAWTRAPGRAPGDVAIVGIQGGHYFLGEPVRFTLEDSAPARGRIRYVGVGERRPVFSGGRRITGWKAASLNGRAVWAAELSEVREGRWYFRQLWVNGERRPRARHPNRGYLAVESIPEAKAGVAWSEGQAQFRFKAADLQAWPTVAHGEVRVMNRWVESHLPVVRVDEAQRLVNFGKHSVFKLDAGDLYYLEHVRELLDAPGEWYLDRAAGVLYYAPKPGESMEGIEAIAPVLSELVRFDGKPEAGGFIERLSFENLTFAHSEWYFPDGFDAGKDKAQVWPPPKADVGGFAQAAVGVPGAVRGEGVREVAFEGCRFVHLGGYALELGRGCRSNAIHGCDLGDLGAGGIKLGETMLRRNPAEVARDNEVVDCHIHDGGQMFHSAIGIWIGQSPSNRLLHNHIHDFYYTGISIGWTWGYGEARATNNTVAFNHVHHIGVKSDGDGPILSDMAGIYTLGLQAGTVIRNNLWHDIAGIRYGGWGIYFDEGTTRILAENNVVCRTTHGGFHQHYGKDNIVRNNVFAFARDHQIQRSRPESHRSFTFERNLVYWNRGVLLGGNYDDSNYLFQSNLYWPEAGGEVRFAKGSFAQWQARGQDTNSLIANPQFANPARDDFTLRPGSPASRVGFQPIDLRTVGVRRRR
ncbi:MAG: right-handed parallel beta-helix repeat-containing protein [Verrucomicrobia bacterium]|nr:right-handed parallel beta-helix repeat-containing protein [Verrucomicrobiota bacterium]